MAVFKEASPSDRRERGERPLRIGKIRYEKVMNLNAGSVTNGKKDTEAETLQRNLQKGVRKSDSGLGDTSNQNRAGNSHVEREH